MIRNIYFRLGIQELDHFKVTEHLKSYNTVRDEKVYTFWKMRIVAYSVLNVCVCILTVTEEIILGDGT